MPEQLPKTCDNTSVGVLIHDPATDTWLMFDRNTPPPGTAPVAGHVDEHGSPVLAAAAGTKEESGLTASGLTLVTGGWRFNACRRLPGPAGTGHHWSVYQATTTGALSPSARETRNTRWLSAGQIQQLVDQSIHYARARRTQPGIEPVWVQWLVHAGIATANDDDLRSLDLIARICTFPAEDPS